MSRPKDVLWMSRPSFSQPGEVRTDGRAFPMPSLVNVEKPIKYPFTLEFGPETARAFGPESFRVAYQFHSFWPVLLNVQLHAEGSDVKLSWNPNDAFSFAHSVDLNNIRKAAQNPAIWNPEYTLVQPRWSLEWWDPPLYRAVDGVHPPAGPFLELCFSILREVGFEFETQLVSTEDGMQYYTLQELLEQE